jgi:glycosyltransferase involved in cell wall biosynthesis
MLSGHNIIYFAPGRWSGLWRNRQQLMSIFATQNTVLYVESRLSLGQTITYLRRGNLKFADFWQPPIRQVAKNLFVLRYPLWALASNHLHIGPFTSEIRRLCVQYAMRKLHMSDPIVWYALPSMIDLVPEIPSARLRVYHVVDEYAAYSHLTPEASRHTEAIEQEMLQQADLVIVVSHNLYTSKSRFNSNTVLVPNGVNCDAYNRALNDPQLPEVLQGIKPPRLGYIGLIGDKLDFSLLKALAETHQEWSLVFVGEERVSAQAEVWKALTALPNVYYLGQVHVSEVPHYVKGFNVGLLPYVYNRHAENICPLKLYDYLAAGIPVASVDIPAVREFKCHIQIANSLQEFPGAIGAALVDTDPERCQVRRDVARQHTWTTRVEQLSEVMQARLSVV